MPYNESPVLQDDKGEEKKMLLSNLKQNRRREKIMFYKVTKVQSSHLRLIFRVILVIKCSRNALFA